MKKKNKTFSTKSAVATVVSCILSLTLALMTFIAVLNTTLLNDRTIYSRVSDSTYFSELNNDIVTRCQTIAVKSGVDYSLVEKIITSSRIDVDYTVYFNSISGKNPQGGRNTINEKSLADEIYTSITEADSDMTVEEKETVRVISSQIASEYKNTIVAETFEKFVGFSQVLKTYSKYVFFILVALFVYLVCVLVWFNGKNRKHRLFRKFAVVSGPAGLTVLFISVFIKVSGVMNRITFVTTQREYNLFISFFDSFTDTLIVTGAGWLAVCIVLLVLWYVSVSGRTGK